MSHVMLTVRQLAFIAGTRGMLGAGVGLLLSERLPAPKRRKVGLALLLLGVVTTIPAARLVLGSRSSISHELPGGDPTMSDL